MSYVRWDKIGFEFSNRSHWITEASMWRTMYNFTLRGCILQFGSPDETAATELLCE